MTTAEEIADAFIAQHIDVDAAQMGSRIIHRSIAVAISMQKPNSQNVEAVMASVVGLTISEAMKLAVMSRMSRADFFDLCGELWRHAEESIAEIVKTEGSA